MVGLFRKSKVPPKPSQIQVKPEVPIGKLKEYYDKAVKSLRAEKESQAEFYIKKILKERPKDVSLLRNLAELIMEIEYIGYEDDAEFCFKRIIKLDPNDKAMWDSYVDLASSRIGGESKMIETINAALERFPRDEGLMEMKCQTLIDWGYNGLEILKNIKILKDINPTNKLIHEFKESAIEIIMENEEDDNPEILDLIDKI